MTFGKTHSSSVGKSIFKTRGPLDPVNDSAIYIPRPELEQLTRAAQATSVDAYVAILSSRQTGKTTLLYQLRHRLRARGLGTALLDLSVIREQPEEQLYRFVASEMQSELEPYLPRLKDRSALPGNSIEFRRFWLDLARQVRTPRIVILIDEVDAVPEKYSDAFFGTIRNIFSSRHKEDEIAFEKYLCVFSGATELNRLTSGSNSPLNIADRIYLHDLPVAGIQTLACNLERIGITVPPETGDWLFAQTGGHPYLTQRLCQIIEQWHPAAVDADLVQHAADEVLSSDDHLSKLLSQLDVDLPASNSLKSILTGSSVNFTRVSPAIARLDLMGAIREEKHQCVIRNAIYLAAFKAHWNIKNPPKQNKLKNSLSRLLIAIIAVALVLINVPFLYVYTTDIILARHSVSQDIPLPNFSANAIARYDPILRANSSTPVPITVQVDNFTSTTPISVTLHPNDPDLVTDGDRQRILHPPSDTEKFSITLYEHGIGAIPYNPLNVITAHRSVDLIFESQTRGRLSHTATLDFRVDYYSAFMASVITSAIGLLTTIATLLGNLQKARDILNNLLGKLAKPST